MKKLISIAVVVFMIAAMIPAVVNAEAEEEYVSPGNVIVPFTTGQGITIDGTLAQGEWSETNKLLLEAKTNFKPWAGFPEYRGHIDYYYSWGDKGLYMAAVVLDDTLEDGIGSGNLATRFQIALNPAGIICDMYGGLFFSLTPEADSDVLHMYRHNWETSADAAYDATEDEGYEGKYTLLKEGEEVIGWNMECLIPWSMIASEDRYADLDEDDEIYLTNFNPKDENRKRAFCTATICYVQCNTPDGQGLEALARTATDGDANNFNTDSYDIVLLFALPGETDRSTETEYFTPAPSETTEEVTTEADTTKADDETKADDTTKADETKADDTTKADETKADDTTKANTPATTTSGTPSGGGLPTGAIIGIIIGAVVAVAAVVAAIVLSKKKKA